LCESRTLLITDANGYFASSVQLVQLLQLRNLVPSLTVVGVGYRTDSGLGDTVQRRARDFTPTHTSTFEMSGGASAFASLIADELKPRLDERRVGTSNDMTFFGHSLGGLFGVIALLDDPSLFSRYILGSPSLWWDKYLTFDRETEFAQTNSDLDADVYTAIGAWEDDAGRRCEGANLPDDHPAKPPLHIELDMVDDLARFTRTITARNYPSLGWTSEVIPDEFHISVAMVVLSRGLRHHFATSRT